MAPGLPLEPGSKREACAPLDSGALSESEAGAFSNGPGWPGALVAGGRRGGRTGWARGQDLPNERRRLRHGPCPHSGVRYRSTDGSPAAPTGRPLEGDMGRLGTAIEATGVEARQGSRLLYDNSPCFISKELGTYPEECAIEHTRGQDRTLPTGARERVAAAVPRAADETRGAYSAVPAPRGCLLSSGRPCPVLIDDIKGWNRSGEVQGEHPHR